MANCNTTIQRLIFDLTDPQITKVRVEIDFDGDCPVNFMKRVYEKSFPARIPAVELMMNEIPKYLEW